MGFPWCIDAAYVQHLRYWKEHADELGESSYNFNLLFVFTITQWTIYSLLIACIRPCNTSRAMDTIARNSWDITDLLKPV